MLQKLRRVSDYLLLGYDLYSWFGLAVQYGPAVLLTMVALYSTYLANLPWHWVIFCASGVFAFTSVGATNLLAFMRRAAIVDKLRVERTVPQVVHADHQAHTCSIYFKVRLENTSETQGIWIEMAEGYVDLQERINSAAETAKLPVFVAPRSIQSVQTHAVKQIDMTQPANGTFRVRVRFGRRADKMPYMLTYEMKPVLEFSTFEGSDSFQVHFGGQVTQQKSERA